MFSCSRARRPSPAHSQARAVVSVLLAVVCYSRSHHTHHLAPTHRRLCLCRCGANKPRPSADTERVGWLDDGCGAAGGGRVRSAPRQREPCLWHDVHVPGDRSNVQGKCKHRHRLTCTSACTRTDVQRQTQMFAGMEAGVGTAASDTQHVNMQAFMMRCFV